MIKDLLILLCLCVAYGLAVKAVLRRIKSTGLRVVSVVLLTAALAAAIMMGWLFVYYAGGGH